MHAPDQVLRARRQRGMIIPRVRRRISPGLIDAVALGAEAGRPPVDLLSEEEIRLESLQALRDVSGRNLGVTVKPQLAGTKDPFFGDITLAAALSNRAFQIPPTHFLNFYDIPDGLGRFDLRINHPDAASIDMLRAGNGLVWPTPIEKIFVTTAPAIAGSTLKFFLGEARINRDRIRGTTGPCAVHFGHLSHTQIATTTLVFTFPLVPVGLKHVYDLLSLTSSQVNRNFVLNVSTGAGVICASLYFQSTAARRRPMVGITIGSSSSEIPAGPLTIWGGERLVIRAIQDITLGQVVAVDYRYRVEAGVQIHAVDPQVVVETEPP